MYGSEISEKIKAYCYERNMKVSELLRISSLSAHLIDDWQNGKTEPSFPALIRICESLSIDIKDLFVGGQRLTVSQIEILEEWRVLSDIQRSAIFDYIDAMKGCKR